MLTNYFIGCWGGRRCDYLDGNLFIKKHLEQLCLIEHNLDLITIGYPYCDHEPKYYSDFMKFIKKQGQLADGTPVDVIHVGNEGMSYGQFSKAFEKYKDEFDYYIFTEDDYPPIISNFDEVLIDIYQRKNVGYLCGLVVDENGHLGKNTIRHGAISTGIFNIECLLRIYEKFGEIPHKTTGAVGWSQINFTRSPIDVGYEIGHYIDEFRVLFWDHQNICVYGNPKKKDIFVPIQFLEFPDLHSYSLYDEKGSYKEYGHNYFKFPWHL